MELKKLLRFGKRVFIQLVCLAFLATPSFAQKAGAHYFADADGNGIIEVPDLIALNTVLGNFSADDVLLYSGYPQSRYRQDLDGNGIIEVPDLIILNSWVPGDFSNNPGAPDRLLLDGDTHLNLNLGDSVTLNAYALSPVSAGSQVRTGFGVIFKIDPASTCATAQIRGYDVAGGATVNAWRNPSAYHYTLQPGAPDNGRASVRVNANGCSGGQVIKVEVYIPDDTEAGLVPGRFPTKLSTAQKFNITIPDVNPPDTFITANPPDPTHSQDATFEFNCSEASCTYECKLDIGSWESCTSPRNYGEAESWVATSTTNTPLARRYHHSIWTGTEMIVWGGYNGSYRDTGGRYNPSTDSWISTSTTNAPTGRYSFAAVWTGTEIIVWGGYNGSYLNSGGRYNPATDSWTATTSINAPTARIAFPAVWTGSEMILFGGFAPPSFKGDGFKYNPTNDSWTQISTTNAPSARTLHAMVWTGSRMIVWGGLNLNDPLNTGGIYNPVGDSWTPTSTGANVPSPRFALNSVWTGTDMIVWGGANISAKLNSGGRYNLATNSWLATSTTNAPSARDWEECSIGAVWTGNEMLIWGGDNSPLSNDGGRYNPLTDTWTATSTTNAPAGRYGTDIVWTGARMIAWGGYNGSSYLNTGGVYSPPGGLGEGDHTFEVRAYDLAMNVDPTPASYSWTIDLTAPNTTITSYPPNPSNSADASFEFSCNETNCTFECKMDSGSWEACASPKNYTGLSDAIHAFQVRAIDAAGNIDQTPASYTWKIDTIAPNTTINSAPANPTNSSSAQFTFSCNETGCIFECNLDSIGWEPCTSPVSYSSLLETTHTFEIRATDPAGNTDQTPASFTWTIDQTPPDTAITSNPPDPDNHNHASFAFTCNELPCTYECNLDSGGWVACASPKNYTELVNSSHNFQVRATDSAGNVDPSPATYTWTATANPPDTFITAYPLNPTNSQNAAFEFDCSEAPCTYECKLDTSGWESCTSPKTYVGAESWTATTTTNAPPARRYHTAVWTGTEMIVWGGYGSSPTYKNDGGRYSPTTDSWTATTTTNAPSARSYHTAVWTGTVMIVWGGNNGSNLNSGGKYNPSTDSWNSTSTGMNVPSIRQYHTAVWTGTEMIVWGGQGSSPSYKNDGGRYNPSTDYWTPTSTGTNVPTARWKLSSVWTGTEMIVWGGYNGSFLNTGGRYNPSADSWIATTTTNAPVARQNPTPVGVWTGTEMIVWGGYNNSYLNTGGRYNPSTNTWTPTSTGANVPFGREQHTAIWTGNEIIVWGGAYNSGSWYYLNSGGLYDPVSDSWTATPTGANVPSQRAAHAAVWTGAKMIVWGGELAASTYTNTGGVYFPGGGNLTEGDHNFQVRASDLDMNVDLTPASYTWTIDLTEPETTINSAPPDPSNSPDATFEFSCNETGCDFECNLDAGGWSSCASPEDYLGLSDGDHEFQVRAIDPATNIDPTPASYSWTINP